MEKGSVREQTFETRARGRVAVETHVRMRAGNSLAPSGRGTLERQHLTRGQPFRRSRGSGLHEQTCRHSGVRHASERARRAFDDISPGVCDDGDERQQRVARRTSSSEVEEKAEVRRVERRGDVVRREREHRRAARDCPYPHRPRRHPETTAEKRHQVGVTACQRIAVARRCENPPRGE